ncbi:DUF6912 family protein [Propioniciclava sinopodophylli]|uniref:DUF6912 family protein n=1 Tax=Propioniciclava sinopodophylli TaxID=1837344 RepID=UPI00248FAA46|nr:hypothetical protein [Propioniciclava sinopodophylli]
MLVFVPLSPPDLDAWASSGRRDVSGFAATPVFLETFGLPSHDIEDADLTLLEVAGVAGLLAHGVRLVAVCQTEASGSEPAEFGAVVAEGVRWGAVESLFADDADGAARAAAVGAVLAGAGLEEAWEADAVSDLLRGTELLWHNSTEWEPLSH